MQRILIVDDERLVADTLALVFRKSGFEVSAAYSADEAMRAARDWAPDLMLCDVTMPGKDGLALAQEMNEEIPSCRVLFLTGFETNVHALRRHQRKLPRSVDIMTKPCEPADLLRRAQALLLTA